MGHLYIIAAFSMLVAVAMGLIETFEVRRFNRMYFDIGLKVFSREIELKAVDQQNIPTEVIYKKEGKFKFITVGECLFVSSAGLLDFSRFQAPLPFKGSAIWRKDRVCITGRLPLGRVAILVLFAIIWSAVSLQDDLIVYVIVLLVMIFLVVVGYIVEKTRMEKMILELEEIVAESRENVSIE